MTSRSNEKNSKSFVESARAKRELRALERKRILSSIRIQSWYRGCACRRSLLSQSRANFDALLPPGTEQPFQFLPGITLYRAVAPFIYYCKSYQQEVDLKRFDLFCKYLSSVLEENDEIKSFYLGILLLPKLTDSFQRHLNRLLETCCQLLKETNILQIDLPNHQKIASTILRTMLCLTSCNNWKILKPQLTSNQSFLPARARFQLITGQLMEQLQSKENLFLSFSTVLRTGLTRVRPCLSGTSLFAMVALSLRVLLSRVPAGGDQHVVRSERADYLFEFTSKIMSVPAFVYHCAQCSQGACVDQLVSQRVFAGVLSLLIDGRHQTYADQLFQQFVGSPDDLLCFLANFIQLGSIEMETVVDRPIDFNTTVMGLLEFCHVAATGDPASRIGSSTSKGSNFWHPLFGWYGHKMDPALNDAIPYVLRQIRTLWSVKTTKVLFADLIDFNQRHAEFVPPVEKRTAAGQHKRSLLSRLIHRCANKSSASWSASPSADSADKLSSPAGPNIRLDSQLAAVTLSACDMFLTALITLKELRLDLIAGLSYQPVFLSSVWQFFKSLGPCCGLKELVQIATQSGGSGSLTVTGSRKLFAFHFNSVKKKDGQSSGGQPGRRPAETNSRMNSRTNNAKTVASATEAAAPTNEPVAWSCWSTGPSAVVTPPRMRYEPTFGSLMSCLSLFCETANLLISVMDDKEFYEEQKVFSKDDLILLSSFLNRFLYNLMVSDSQSSPLAEMLATDSSHILSIISLLMVLLSRDARRPFAPENHWLLKECKPKDFMYDLEKGKSHARFLLEHMPHILPHRERVVLFRHFVQKEREALGIVEPSAGDSSPVARYHPMPATMVSICRGRIIEDGYRQLSQLPAVAVKGTIRVKFVNEMGLDEAGIDQDGVFKEFLEETIHAVFNPTLNLFRTTSDNKLYPSATSFVHDNHLQLFEFVGRMLGKALYEGIVVDVPFAAFFLTQLLGRHATAATYSFWDELPSLDQELYNSLSFIKHYDGDVAELDLTFSYEEDCLGKLVTHELVPGGRALLVTNENKLSYIHRMAWFRMHTQIHQQTAAFVRGFRAVIPVAWLRMFSTRELQMLISGEASDIDVQDLRKNTQYYGGFHNQHKVVCWLWDILAQDFSPVERQQFLKFVTSCSKPPLLGFAHLEPPFSIRCVEVSEDMDTGDTVGTVLKGFLNIRKDPVGRLPTSSTCFNLLKLPNYQKRSTLREKLRYAISSNTGFELS